VQTFLIASPTEFQAATHRGCQTICAAYRIGSGSTLLRQSLPLQSRGGLLWMGERGAPLIEDPESLCAAVLRECSRRGYNGAVLDFEESPRQDRQNFVHLLHQRLQSRNLQLYLPEDYSRDTPEAIILIGTALSGGTLRERLEEAVRQHGSQHLALDVERLRMNFPLPCPEGTGLPLSEEELARLLEQERPAVFFSPDLCVRYFTYTHKDQHHFVLFDDAGTIQEKLRLGAELGITTAFLSWPEIADLAEELFPQSR